MRSPPTTTPAADWAGLDLDKLTDIQRRVFWCGYFLGWQHGTDRGRELADAEAAEQWRGVAEYVRQMAKQPTQAELCDRRNEPERAERARANERRVMSR